MTMQISKDHAVQIAKRAQKFMTTHKQSVGEVKKGIEAFAAPFALGLFEGYLAKDGSGYINVAGVPLRLLLGGGLLAGAASGYLDEYTQDAGNMAAGLLGSYGNDKGRNWGLEMRAKSGKGVAPAVAAATKQACGGFAAYHGLPNDPFQAIGAAPGALSPEALAQLVNQAAASNQ